MMYLMVMMKDSYVGISRISVERSEMNGKQLWLDMMTKVFSIVWIFQNVFLTKRRQFLCYPQGIFIFQLWLLVNEMIIMIRFLTFTTCRRLSFDLFIHIHCCDDGDWHIFFFFFFSFLLFSFHYTSQNWPSRKREGERNREREEKMTEWM